MARQDLAFLAMNRGLVSRLGLARADVKRIALSAQTYNNYMPRVLGSMSIRGGFGYLAGILNNLVARFLPFIFSTSDKALIELTDSTMRVWVDDAVIERPEVTTVITNGTFNTDLSGWSDDDESGGTSSWVSPGYMQLVGNGTAAARRTQTVTVGANAGIEHALKIKVARGPVTIRVGSSAGEDDYISEADLDLGEHSLAFTPAGNFYIRFQSRLERVVWLNSVEIEAAGDMTVVTPWTAERLSSIRSAPSGDVLFCTGYRQYKIERRGTRSWGVSEYLAPDGPFRVRNFGPITMTSNTFTGNGTLTASAPYFKSTHVGALFKVTSDGQQVFASITAQNTFTNAIEVTGVGAGRTFAEQISGLSGTGSTVTLQRSLISSSGPWADYVNGIVADEDVTINDTLDNQTIWYRIGVKTGDYSSGTINATLIFQTGSIDGIGRVTAFTSSTVVNIEVLSAFGSNSAASSNWAEGQWSDRRGYPTSVQFYEGRLGWFGRDLSALSVSDDYYSYDSDTEGDSGPIVRTIGSGPVDTINWALALQRLLIGGQGAEHSCRSSAFDEPLTPTNFNIKKASGQGSAAVEAVEIDSNGIYIQRGGSRVFMLEFNGEKLDYISTHLSAIIPEIGKPSIVRIAAQRQPDTRIHFVRSDGTAAVLVFDKVENVTCWVTVSTPGGDGLIEDVVILPGDDGDDEDHVYYVVKRTIDGSTVRNLEKWAFQEDCIGGDITMLADSFTAFTGPITTLTGLDHLEGEQVVVWADGEDVGHDENGDLIYTVSGGEITLEEQASVGAVVGLPYTAQWRSGKLGQLQSQIGLAIKDQKNIAMLGVILADVHPKGLTFGRDFNNLDDLPAMYESATITAGTIFEDYDIEPVPFPGDYSINSRICLQSIAPRPCTVLAVVAKVEHHG